MKQRNTTGQTIDVPEVGTVEPDEVVDAPHPISGFTPEKGSTAPGYAGMKRDALVALAESRGVEATGTKAEIAARLDEADALPPLDPPVVDDEHDTTEVDQ
jgi:hypothetical protein